MSHWYQSTPSGIVPCYEMPRANGIGTRQTTLADARELGLLPSVTTVLGIINKPELQRWIVDNAINSALTLPRNPDEELGDFKERVFEDSNQISRGAMDFGTRIHDAIEKALTLGLDGYPIDPDLIPFVEPTLIWLEQNLIKVFSCEKYVGSQRIGAAGRLDLSCNLSGHGVAIVDFKTQRVRKAPAFYIEWAAQLAAYSAMESIGASLISVVIDNQKPGPPHIKVWDDPEYHWQAFQHAYELWVWQKGYDPRKAANPESEVIK